MEKRRPRGQVDLAKFVLLVKRWVWNSTASLDYLVSHVLSELLSVKVANKFSSGFSL